MREKSGKSQGILKWPTVDNQVTEKTVRIHLYNFAGNISQQKSLVLTAEEFARLTNQGVLRFDPPKQESTVQPHIIPSVTKTSVSPCASQPPVTSSVPVYSSHKLNIDDNDVSNTINYEFFFL